MIAGGTATLRLVPGYYLSRTCLVPVWYEGGPHCGGKWPVSGIFCLLDSSGHSDWLYSRVPAVPFWPTCRSGGCSGHADTSRTCEKLVSISFYEQAALPQLIPPLGVGVYCLSMTAQGLNAGIDSASDLLVCSNRVLDVQVEQTYEFDT